MGRVDAAATEQVSEERTPVDERTIASSAAPDEAVSSWFMEKLRTLTVPSQPAVTLSTEIGSSTPVHPVATEECSTLEHAIAASFADANGAAVDSDGDTDDVRVRSRLGLESVDTLDGHAPHNVIEEHWRPREHGREVLDFVGSRKEARLFAFFDNNGILRLQKQPPQPSHGWKRIAYFIRAGGSPLDQSDLEEHVTFGVVQGNVTDCLLNILSHVYVPQLLSSQSWPESVKKDFTGQLHKFMANLTESAYEARGQTVLYIPEEHISNPMEAAKDKDFVKELESTVIHWTRQVKEVVNQQDMNEAGEDAGPLEEIEFWRSRNADLGGIRAQLDHPNVKAICQVLEHSKSSYLDPFTKLSTDIQREASAAESNLRFLRVLEEPSRELSNAQPKAIPGILPRILHRVRVIWNVSEHYNTPERIIGLLRKVSNAIINRCSDKISLSDIIDGDVETSKQLLCDSIEAGESWKRSYSRAAAAVGKWGNRAWDFDSSNIFAHIDAFIQRCRDMLDVCEAESQFSPKIVLPAFGGTRGPEITKSLQDIQNSFHKLIESLRTLNYRILDVKATQWYDDYNSFKNGVQDLEVLMNNVIMLAFDSVPSLSARVELLEAFENIARHKSVKQSVERKAQETYTLFMDEIKSVSEHFHNNKGNPPRDYNMSRFSGAAMWAESLRKRLEQPVSMLQASADFLPNTATLPEVFKEHSRLHASLEHYKQNECHQKWIESIDLDLYKRLEQNLIQVNESKGGLLERSFDSHLLDVLEEIRVFQDLELEIPYSAADLSTRRDHYRILREEVLLLVRDYNRILTSLDGDERKLFANRIQYLDGRIYPGATRLNWTSSKGQLEAWIKDARKHCQEVFSMVKDYKSAMKSINHRCDEIAATTLLNIEPKRGPSGVSEFEDIQKSRFKKVRDLFEHKYMQIKETLEHVHQIFQNDSEDVQQEWAHLTHRIDNKIFDALRSTVKRSLSEFSKLINGDKRRKGSQQQGDDNDMSPIFSVSVVLNGNDNINLQPTIADLRSVVESVCYELVAVTSTIPRVKQERVEDNEYGGMKIAEPNESFFDKVNQGKSDEDSFLPQRLISGITSGISSIEDDVRTSIKNFQDDFRTTWEKNKDAYMRRMENNPLSKFDADISTSTQYANNALSRDRYPNQSRKFLHIDYSPAKQEVYNHCQEWIYKLTALLNKKAKSRLDALYEYMSTNSERLSQRPQTIDGLTESVNLLNKLKEEKEEIQGRFQPLQDMYSTLDKYGVDIAEEESERLEQLEHQWAEYEQTLDSASEDLEKTKESFREKLKKMVDSFVSEVSEHRQRFMETAPFHQNDVTNPDVVNEALKYIEESAEKCEEFRRHERELHGGMEIFRMPHPPLKELQSTENDLQSLRSLWNLIKEWNDTYAGWKDGKFRSLQVEEMEATATSFGKRIQKMGRDVKSWGAWAAIKDVIDAFKRTMPLITDLRNPALRQRHWNQLMETVGEAFDPHSDNFTLARVTALRLDQFSEKISELSNNASKELGIEQSLENIRKTWDELELDIVPYREDKEVFKLRSTEDIFTALEDNIVQLSQMKASRFFVTFEQSITQWEQSLSLVSEVLEMVLKVQMSWMYLENIFCGSGDIRRQLPDESVLFDDVDNSFSKCMSQMAEERNAVRACSLPGMLDNFNQLDEKLEKIQRSLEDYLETKRQKFARFYFISSDDLLEILGQSREPENVQPHLKGMFEGMNKLEIHKPAPHGSATDVRRSHHASGIFGPDGEHLQFMETKSLDGRPEDWLNEAEKAMNQSVKWYLYKTLENSRSMKKEKWVRENPGQCIITAGQIIWTSECERALSNPESARASLKHLKKRRISYLNKLTGLTRSKLSKIDRSKVVALITIEVHARDVIDRLIRTGCTTAHDFEWVSQLRFYWDSYLGRDGMGECIVKQVLNVFNYGYEYQGNNGRLVITPLTDRCYMTLGTALYTKRGGNPLGPAGTGKTETVKDFGKALARYVVVFNCSDGVDNKMTGKMFSGLAQTGAWACLDEFNRIPVEVLSVVATQISTMMNAIKAGTGQFLFEGQEIKLVPSCGVFVTMNPGYAGRSELPDNLKAILRPVSMMVPDFSLIAEILLFSEGFQTARALSKKMVSIMELSQQQLSKQDHYDYGLRSFIIPIARASGSLKRSDPEATEELLMYKTMRDLIMPKLVYADLPLFQALLGDLFPGVELPEESTSTLRKAVEAELKENNLQVVSEFVDKVMQIYDCKVARHGNMIVGQTGAGKSEAWRTLQRAIGRLKTEGVEGEWEKVHVYPLNPLSLTNEEMYGKFDESTHEWSDGVLAKIMRNVSKDSSPSYKWVLFDGPVDTLWVESMNTLLDDNKLLTLLSGERIMMPQQVSLLFEVDDLSQASPATVSRAGMIYLNVEDLGWWPYVKSWLAMKEDSFLVENLQRNFENLVDAALDLRSRECTQVIKSDNLSAVKQLCSLFDATATKEAGVTKEDSDSDTYSHMIDLHFMYALIWSIGGSLNDESRKRFDNFLREMDSRFPGNDTVFEFYVDGRKKQWQHWDEKLPSAFKPPADVPYHRVMVPTIDTIRTQAVVSSLMSCGCNALIVGNVGVGKTLIGQSILSKLSESKSSMQINFSAQTSAQSLQFTIEGKMEKQTKGVFAPVGGKKLVAYIDDLNMPRKSTFGFIPPLELLKFWIDYGFWYDRYRKDSKHIKDMQLLTSMAPPGGGRNSFGERIAACYSIIHVASPSDSQLKRIFSSLLNHRLQDFDDEVKTLADGLTSASIDVFNTVSSELLPIPSKSHYLFNTRDLSRVILGIMRARRQYYDNKDAILQLWVHENLRVYSDRMWDQNDKDWIVWLLDQRMLNYFSSSWKGLFDSRIGCPPFATFMRDVETPPYEAVTDEAALKRFLSEKLDEYGNEPNVTPMDLVLFRDALHHVCRIHRILTQPQGNALLVGVGGSGRKSLARLAAYVAEMKIFSIEMTGKYRINDFHEDLKALFRQAGVQQKETMFLFDENQIVEERFLEDVNNVLTSGEVPNLFPKDELQSLCEEIRPSAKREGIVETMDELYSYFIQRVKNNMHIVICLSPIGEAFTERLRMFPGLVNCCTIDWFSEWPSDALYEVAQKQLENEDLGSEAVKNSVCSAFVTAHQSTRNMSEKMLAQYNRRNYVTPTNYLDFVNGYKSLLKEKRSDLDSKANKLRGGLSKLDETGEQVKEMQGVIQEKKKTVADAKKNAEDTLVSLVQKKRDADEQEKQVKAESERIEKEAEEADRVKQEADDGLAKAQPELERARSRLEVISDKDLSEMKAYAKPPAAVDYCMKGVMTVLKKRKTWEEAKAQLSKPRVFKDTLKNFDESKLDDNLLGRMKEYVDDTTYFSPEYIRKNGSGAAEGLCQWVHAMYAYGIVLKDVAPKRREAEKAQANLEKKQAELREKQQQLEEVNETVKKLKEQYDESTNSKQQLENELEDLETKLERAENLVNGLAGERRRWEETIAQYEHELQCLPGDVIVAAAFLSYAGPFPSEYRDELAQNTWLPQVKSLSIPSSPNFDFTTFLADPSDVRDWNIQGLPADTFSTENGVMVTRGWRWTLMIDPQGQATKWVRNMEKPRGLTTLTPNRSDMLRQLESCIQLGTPVLLEDLDERVDPTLEPLLAKAFVKRGSQLLVKLGDKEIEMHPHFKLYLATKLSNPHYTPEVSTKVAIVNFQVKETGLESQLLNLVVQKERPDLDKQKSENVTRIAQGKRTLQELEDQLLDLLANSTGSLLDNLELINTLNQSKQTSNEVTEKLKVAEQTKEEIENASSEYKPISTRAATLYFVLNDLASIDPMYQFSLESYIDLFTSSIARAPRSENIQERIKNLNDFHTYAVYKYTTRGIFEAHKLLLSLQMTLRILYSSNQINIQEWQFFLSGGQVIDRSRQPPNPAPQWITAEAWDNITELENLPHFAGIVQSFDQYLAAWEAWYRSTEPENSELPGEWESKCDELQRMILVRSLRLDRVTNAATSYVANTLGRKYVEPPVLDLDETYQDSSPYSPLVFVLSPGVDPSANLRQLAQQKGMEQHFYSVALGQGQAPVATQMINDAVVSGAWVFLANCHLMISWLPELQKIIESLEDRQPHFSFRLWLSSNPTPSFPLGILQKGIKMTTEPPKGLKANLSRLYNTITEEEFSECRSRQRYPKLLFSLAFFHSVLLERRKFRTLGFNVLYDFNDTDFKVSDDVLKAYLDEYDETPWDALRYLIADANYGGRVTDELDRRVLHSYLNIFFNEEAINTPNHKLSSLQQYYIPDTSTLQGFREYIASLPNTDQPEAFGQHPNADISYMQEDAKMLLQSCLSLQPKSATSSATSERKEDMVMRVTEDMLSQLPEPFDLEQIKRDKADDMSALHVVLVQEVERYNDLLLRIRMQCKHLQKAIKGLVVMSAELEATLHSLYMSEIPASWLKAYPSLKPLGSWTRDLLARIDQLSRWINHGYPKVYWLGGFTYPNAFLTAVLQTTARKNSVAIDSLSWEFQVINLDESEVTTPPKEGVYLKGLYLEGAGWDTDTDSLMEPDPMELVTEIPLLHMKPTENKKAGKSKGNMYSCPLYMYPIRTGTRERPSYIISVDLKAGSKSPDHWVLRGTALLASLST